MVQAGYGRRIFVGAGARTFFQNKGSLNGNICLGTRYRVSICLKICFSCTQPLTDSNGARISAPCCTICALCMDISHDSCKNTLIALDAATSGGGTSTGDADTKRANIVNEAAYWIGRIPYCINSVVTTRVLDRNDSPPYMDCSDFSTSVYLTVLGINIGANTAAQIQRGTSVAVSDMKPGDLILFDWNGNGSPQHVGICSATNEMIDEHGSNSNPNNFIDGENVRRKTLTTYYQQHILAVRRIIQDDGSIVN